MMLPRCRIYAAVPAMALLGAALLCGLPVRRAAAQQPPPQTPAPPQRTVEVTPLRPRWLPDRPLYFRHDSSQIQIYFPQDPDQGEPFQINARIHRGFELLPDPLTARGAVRRTARLRYLELRIDIRGPAMMKFDSTDPDDTRSDLARAARALLEQPLTLEIEDNIHIVRVREADTIQRELLADYPLPVQRVLGLLLDAHEIEQMLCLDLAAGRLEVSQDDIQPGMTWKTSYVFPLPGSNIQIRKRYELALTDLRIASLRPTAFVAVTGVIEGEPAATQPAEGTGISAEVRSGRIHGEIIWDVVRGFPRFADLTEVTEMQFERRRGNSRAAYRVDQEKTTHLEFVGREAFFPPQTQPAATQPASTQPATRPAENTTPTTGPAAAPARQPAPTHAPQPRQ